MKPVRQLLSESLPLLEITGRPSLVACRFNHSMQKKSNIP
jgi:hypothetical protein